MSQSTMAKWNGNRKEHFLSWRLICCDWKKEKFRLQKLRETKSFLVITWNFHIAHEICFPVFQNVIFLMPYSNIISCRLRNIRKLSLYYESPCIVIINFLHDWESWKTVGIWRCWLKLVSIVSKFNSKLICKDLFEKISQKCTWISYVTSL